MFSTLYIEKCKKAQEEIQYFRVFEQVRKEKDGILKPFSFEKGDYFHHPGLMEEGEVKVVKEITGSNLYASDLTEAYPQDKSIWIPTVKQMRAGLEAVVRSLSDEDFKHGEEHLLDKIMENREKKQWDKEKREWVKMQKIYI